MRFKSKKEGSCHCLVFPFHLYDNSKVTDCHKTIRQIRDEKLLINSPSPSSSQSRPRLSSLKFKSLISSFIFPKVYAAAETDASNSAENVDKEEEAKKQYHYKALEALAKVYISQEQGWDRVKMIFEKDHRGKSDPELVYIQVALVQVFVITFFCKYVPVAKFARKEFIRENQGTVFKTRFEAVRRLQDYTFMRAGHEAALFSTKITMFSAAFLFLSSTISAYRNKTSVLEYTAAAGITGGLARMNMGLKGFIAGSVVGGFLGSLIGLFGYVSLKAYGLSQEERHLESIINKLDVLKSVEGNDSFKAKVNQILLENESLPSSPSLRG